MENKRIMFWDNYKGILIFSVVLAHLLLGFSDVILISYLVKFIYMFHMPAFVFAAGYLSKSENARSKNAVVKLLAAYLIFNSLFILGEMLVEGESVSILEPRYSYWFVLALIAWRISVGYLERIKGATAILLTAAFCVGFWPVLANTLAIGRIVLFYPFFYFGYKFSRDKMESLIKNRRPVHLLAGCFLLLFAVFVAAYTEHLFKFNFYILVDKQYEGIAEVIIRYIGFTVAIAMILVLMLIVPNKKMPLFTKWGRNSLSVFLLHRVFTLLIVWIVENTLEKQSFENLLRIIISIVAALVLCAIFGSDTASRWVNKIIDGVRSKKQGYVVLATVLIFTIAITTYVKLFIVRDFDLGLKADSPKLPVYAVMPDDQKEKYDNAYKILFTGDLILLEDQVKNAYNGVKYDFGDMFAYTKKYIQSADLSIGVFEGPLAGEEAGYTTSNFDDGKDLRLNFPDSFADAVKEAGFDLVTLSNNHILDKGFDGLTRTKDVMEKIGLENVGAYVSEEEKSEDSVRLIDKNGLKIAVLSYTYGCNFYTEDDMFTGEYAFATNMLAEPDGKNFAQAKKKVEADFEKAKSYNPDLIVVLPHMGEQFALEPNKYQTTWCEIFKECGADIILGDHTHSVQPAFVENYKGKKKFTAYCPGNYANIYRGEDGDATAMIEVYVDKTTKEIVGGAVIPMWVQAQLGGNYRALPYYEINKNLDLLKQVSTFDYDRVREVFALETKVMLGEEIQPHIIQPRYYFDENGFKRDRVDSIEMTEQMKNGKLYRLLMENEDVCFVGDSVTVGSNNGGYCWYEPLSDYVRGSLSMVAKGGATTKYVLDNIDKIAQAEADLYVIAIGTNDVRYRDESICAMDKKAYTDRLSKVADAILKKNVNAKLVFIAPWTATDGDTNSALEYEDKVSMNKEYTEALKEFCNNREFTFINANPYIENALKKEKDSKYLIDFIHPNSGAGIRLYTEAVLSYSDTE